MCPLTGAPHTSTFQKEVEISIYFYSHTMVDSIIRSNSVSRESLKSKSVDGSPSLLVRTLSRSPA